VPVGIQLRREERALVLIGGGDEQCVLLRSAARLLCGVGGHDRVPLHGDDSLGDDRDDRLIAGEGLLLHAVQSSADDDPLTGLERLREVHGERSPQLTW
jgi:hypothetical protein